MRAALLAALAYLALAIAMTWPLARHLTAQVPHDLGDPLLVTYLLNWNATVTPLSEAWWSPPFFWPERDVMTLSENLLGLSIVAAPLQWAGLSPLTVYNLLFIASFWTAGLAGCFLGWTLTRSTLAGMVGGLVFMCAPYRAGQLAHLQILVAAGVPLVFAALHRSLDEGGWKWPFVVAACWVWQGHVTGYYLLFLPLIILVWLIWFARDYRVWLRLAVAGGAAAMLALPLLLRYSAAHNAGGYHREFGEIVDFSADVNGLWHTTSMSTLWGGLLPWAHEGNLFPGLATLLLAIVAVTTIPRAPDRMAAVTRFLLVAAALCALVAAIAFAFPGQHVVAGIPVSLTNPHKQLGLTWTALVFAALSSRTVRNAWTQRSPAAGYVIIAGAAWMLALGPMPHFGELPVWYAAPYRFLFTYVPGFNELRVPARLWTIAIAALAALAALAVARLEASRPRLKPLIVALAVIIVIEGWFRLPLRAQPLPLAIPAEAIAVIEVPTADALRDASAMYRSLWHGRPVLNGWSGYTPKRFQQLVKGLVGEDRAVLNDALALGPIAMVIDPNGPYHERYVGLADALSAPCERQHELIVCLLRAPR